LSEDLSRDRRTIYLVRESDGPETVNEIVDEYWEEIFEQELSAWIISADKWPPARTRDMFDAWFDVEFTDSVCDLLPDESLTQSDVDIADLHSIDGRISLIADANVEPSLHESRT